MTLHPYTAMLLPMNEAKSPNALEAQSHLLKFLIHLEFHITKNICNTCYAKHLLESLKSAQEYFSISLACDIVSFPIGGSNIINNNIFVISFLK